MTAITILTLGAALILLGLTVLRQSKRIDSMDKEMELMWISMAELVMERKEKGEEE